MRARAGVLKAVHHCDACGSTQDLEHIPNSLMSLVDDPPKPGWVCRDMAVCTKRQLRAERGKPEIEDHESTYRFVHVPTADVLKLESDDGRSLEGAFVRYAPKLRRSERCAFDAAEIRRAFKARGAAVVITSPVLLPDAVSPADEVSGTYIDPREELRAWFGADSSAESVEALEGCLRILDELRF
jgi:hypothetical protein